MRAGGREEDVPEETTYMTTITYECQEGYKRGVGNWKRTCLENNYYLKFPIWGLRLPQEGMVLLHQESRIRNVTIGIGERTNKGSYDYIYSLCSRNAVQQTNASVGGHCFTPVPVIARQRDLPVFPGLPGSRRGLLPRVSRRWNVEWSASHL